MAITFRLHGELNALVGTNQVVQEILLSVGAMWPDYRCVVHLAKPAVGFVGGFL